MPGDNIYPDFSNDKFDIQYARLLGLSSDLQASIVTGETGVDNVIKTPDDDTTGFMRFGVAGEDDSAGENRSFDLGAGFSFALTQLGNNHFLVDPGNGLYQLGAVPVPGSDSGLSYTYLEVNDVTQKILLQAPEGIVATGYGYGNHAGTATFNLAVDAGGNLIEVATGGGGSGTVNSGLFRKAAYYITNPSGTVVDDWVGVEFDNTNLNTKIISQATTQIQLEIKAISSQSADLFQISSSSGTADLVKVASNGNTTIFNELSSPGSAGVFSEKFGASASVSTHASSLAVGNSATVTGEGGTAIGFHASAGSFGTALGRSSTSASFGIAIGYASNSSGGVSIGVSSNASGTQSLAIATSSTASGDYSFCAGYQRIVSGFGAIGIGYQGGAIHNGSMAFGFQAASTAANQFFAGSPGSLAITDVFFGSGPEHSAPFAYTIHGSGASGTNIAGAIISIAGGKATGNAAGGAINFKTSDAGSSGTTLQTLTNKFEILTSGQLKANLYGAGTFTGTATKFLAVTSAGLVIEEAPPSGGGTVTSFAFTDANGFDGTVTNPTTTPTLSLTTTLTQGSVFFAGASGAIAEDNSNLFFDNTNNILGIGINSSFTATRLNVVDNSVGANNIISITSTSTAAASNLQKGLNVALSGANSTASQTTYGVYSSNIHTGTTGINIGVLGDASGGTNNYGIVGQSLVAGGTNNIAGYFSAAGATNNYGLLVNGGNVGIGDLAPIMKLKIGAGRFGQMYSAGVVAANDLTLPADGNIHPVSGNTTINAITTSGWSAGSIVYLIFSGTPTLKNNTAGGAGTAVMFLAGAVDFAATASDVLTLVYNGSAWFEVCRSVN